ncbi:hypothetical protein M413DRAFT_12446 [Hebeloma cylindrosporum]|uniref:Uncharacterized protein n=1 Tax=Hebeloma cylindrosporum TaxID=76867 RepID=A0A0C3C4K1_HEBCY|nr:hypothetical protein M413DRAFT_12446 [Hebeloma cylindrosporum h7]
MPVVQAPNNTRPPESRPEAQIAPKGFLGVTLQKLRKKAQRNTSPSDFSSSSSSSSSTLDSDSETSNLRLPGHTKFLKPKHYNGDLDARAFHQFMKKSTAYLEDNQIKAKCTVIALFYYLDGKAYDFYIQKVVQNEEEWTAEEFFTELFNFCFPLNYHMQMRKKLDRASRMKRHTINEREPVVKFWKGCKPVIQKALWWDDKAIHKAEIIEISEKIMDICDKKGGESSSKRGGFDPGEEDRILLLLLHPQGEILYTLIVGHLVDPVLLHLEDWGDQGCLQTMGVNSRMIAQAPALLSMDEVTGEEDFPAKVHLVKPPEKAVFGVQLGAISGIREKSKPEVLDSLPLGSISFFDEPQNEPDWIDHSSAPQDFIGDCYAMMAKSQLPKDGIESRYSSINPLADPKGRFNFYPSDDNLEEYIVDDAELNLQLLVLKSSLLDPMFDLDELAHLEVNQPDSNAERSAQDVSDLLQEVSDLDSDTLELVEGTRDDPPNLQSVSDSDSKVSEVLDLESVMETEDELTDEKSGSRQAQISSESINWTKNDLQSFFKRVPHFPVMLMMSGLLKSHSMVPVLMSPATNNVAMWHNMGDPMLGWAAQVWLSGHPYHKTIMDAVIESQIEVLFNLCALYIGEEEPELDALQ